jgi:hypothetical protein
MTVAAPAGSGSDRVATVLAAPASRSLGSEPADVAAAARVRTQTDVPEPLVTALTVSPAKAFAYSRDPYFRAGVQALAAATAGGAPDRSPTVAGLLIRALVLLKPDAVAGRRVGPALRVLRAAGFEVVGLATLRFTPILTRELWRYQFNIASRDRADVVDLLLPAADSLAVLLEDRRWQPGSVPASCRLGDVKGAADPRARRPDDLRSQLAAPTTLFNFIHTTDEPADVLREAALLEIAGVPLLTAAVADPPARRLPDQDVDAAIRLLYDQLPAHDLDAAAAGRRLVARPRFRGLAADATSGGPDWRAVLARCPDGRPAPDELWDLLAVATAQIESNVPGLTQLLPTIRSGDWRRAMGLGDDDR